jgi:hypothetical protein
MKKIAVIVLISFFLFSSIECGEESGDDENFADILRTQIGGFWGKSTETETEHFAPFGASHLWGSICRFAHNGGYEECWGVEKAALSDFEQTGHTYSHGTGSAPSVFANCKEDGGVTFGLVVGAVAATGIVYYGTKKVWAWYHKRSLNKSAQESYEIKTIDPKHRETDLDKVTT